MTWHVQYRFDGLDHIDRHPSPEAAIESACRLIDAGGEVSAIGTGALTDAIGKVEIARIYEFWSRPRKLFGSIPVRPPEPC